MVRFRSSVLWLSVALIVAMLWLHINFWRALDHADPPPLPPFILPTTHIYISLVYVVYDHGIFFAIGVRCPSPLPGPSSFRDVTATPSPHLQSRYYCDNIVVRNTTWLGNVSIHFETFVVFLHPVQPQRIVAGILRFLGKANGCVSI